ncbi:hypothetical protein MNBD_NITROSPINAE02-1166 [hydrothermal vent metagenome]|uniref:DUF5666 domain-containing protein n=1 Tax=hydrothermal vent metagenome TaxID=652676 RepID=A0A3B1CS10_9ZZZZ
MIVAFAVGLFLAIPGSSSVSAGILGNGSDINDNLHIGKITALGDRQVTIATEFEKTSKSYTLDLLPECYVMTADRGVFKKFKELKKGDLIAAYGWHKDGKWNARRIDLLDRNDYLVKRLAADAKAGAYYKHER